MSQTLNPFDDLHAVISSGPDWRFKSPVKLKSQVTLEKSHNTYHAKFITFGSLFYNLKVLSHDRIVIGWKNHMHCNDALIARESQSLCLNYIG